MKTQDGNELRNVIVGDKTGKVIFGLNSKVWIPIGILTKIENCMKMSVRHNLEKIVFNNE